MSDELLGQARNISVELAASSTIVVDIDGPNPPTAFGGNAYSIFWASVDGFVAEILENVGKRPRFVLPTTDGEQASVPRPADLLILTADAHRALSAHISSEAITKDDVTDWAKRLVVLAPQPLLSSDNGYQPLSREALRLTGVAAIVSRDPSDADFVVGGEADSYERELQAAIDRGDVDGALHKLRDRSYLDGLRSRILRLQYEVDHFRLIAEQALRSDAKRARELKEIKRSTRYRLAMAGTAPIQSAKKGRAALQRRKEQRAAIAEANSDSRELGR